jgi:hypothetical protein
VFSEAARAKQFREIFLRLSTREQLTKLIFENIHTEAHWKSLVEEAVKDREKRPCLIASEYEDTWFTAYDLCKNVQNAFSQEQPQW